MLRIASADTFFNIKEFAVYQVPVVLLLRQGKILKINIYSADTVKSMGLFCLRKD